MAVLRYKFLELSKTQGIVIIVDDNNVVAVVSVKPEFALRASCTVFFLSVVCFGPEMFRERRLAGTGWAPENKNFSLPGALEAVHITGENIAVMMIELIDWNFTVLDRVDERRNIRR